MRYDRYGREDCPASAAEKQAVADRIEREDAERARNTRAWNRLCGMVAPIGGPSCE